MATQAEVLGMAATALTAADRCTRCGAQAYHVTVHGHGLELLWCAHHFREHQVKLTPHLKPEESA